MMMMMIDGREGETEAYCSHADQVKAVSTVAPEAVHQNLFLFRMVDAVIINAWLPFR